MKLLLDGLVNGFQRYQPAQRRKGPQQRHVGHRAPHMLHRKLGRRHRQQVVGLEPFDKLAQAELVKGLGGVDQDVAVLLETAEHIDLVQQCRVLDDQRVGLHDGLAQTDLLVIHAAKRHHRCAGALGTKTGKGLGVASALKGGNGQHFRAGHDALPSTAVDAYLEHVVVSFRLPGTLRV